MNRLKTCIWDLDGTLFDSYGSIVSSLEEVAGKCGTTDSSDLIMKAVKQGSVSSYLKGLSAITGKDTGTLYEMYRTVSHARMDEITLIPGTIETLQALKRFAAREGTEPLRVASDPNLPGRAWPICLENTGWKNRKPPMWEIARWTCCVRRTPGYRLYCTCRKTPALSRPEKKTW